MSGRAGVLRSAARVLLFASAAWPFGTAVCAQTSKPAPDESTVIQTIIVTATHRQVNIQNVPLSINAVGGVRLEQKNILSLDDLTKLAPEIQPAVSPTNTSIEMRGAFNTNDAAGTDHSVGVMIDDVPAAGNGDSGLNAGLFDLDRIEILRGPQGTLFGRNVVGGLISLHSREPSFDPSERFEVGYGNDDSYQAQAFVTGPLSDTLAGKLSLNTEGSDDGYLRNRVLGTHAGTFDNIAGRAQLLWKPTSDLSILFGVDALHDRSDAPGQIVGNFQPNVTQPALLTTAPSVGGPAGAYPTLAFGPDDVGVGTNGAVRTDGLDGLIRVNWDVGRLGAFTSITGYRSVFTDTSSSGDFTPFDTTIVDQNLVEKQFSQELRFTSPSTDRFRYVVGLFYLYSDRSLDVTAPLDYSMFAPLSLTGTPTLGYLFETAAALEGLGVVTRFPDPVQNQSVQLSSYAAYTELNFDITPKLTLTVGGRFTDDGRRGSASKTYNYEGRIEGSTAPAGSQIGTTALGTPIIASSALPVGVFVDYPAISGGPGIAASFQKSWSAFTPKVSLSYKPLEHLLFYATVVEGFTAGGFDQRGSTDIALTIPFNPEYTWNYEGGMKATFLEGRLLTNVSIYRQQFSNLQVFVYDPLCGCQSPTNAATAHSQGVEFEGVAKPFSWLTLGVNWAHTDGSYDRYVVPNPAGGAPIDNSGIHLLDTPRDAENLYADTSWSLPDLEGRVGLGANLAFASKRYFSNTKVDGTNGDPAYVLDRTSKNGLLDLDATWTSASGNWEVMLWGKNVTDRRYLISALSGLSVLYTAISPALPASDDITVAGWNKPTMFGVTLTYRH